MTVKKRLEISEERSKFIKDAEDLEGLVKHPGWRIVKDWIDAEKQHADKILHSLEETDTIENLNAKFSYNFVDTLENMIKGVIENKIKILKSLGPDKKVNPNRRSKKNVKVKKEHLESR